MKTVIVSKSQPLGKLKISNVPALKVDSREVLVRIKYAGVNYADLLSVQGLYNWNPPPPYILGLESSGEVVELGKEVTKFKVGDRVVVGSKGGNYAEYITKSEDLVLPLPKQFTFKEGAALCGAWATAWTALFEMARVRPRETVLIHSAMGGVGQAAIKLALSNNMQVYGTASSVEKRKILKKQGVIPLAYSKFYDYFTKNPKQKPDTILESVGGKVHDHSLKILAPMGRIVTIGATSIKLDRKNPLSWYKAWKAFPKVKRSNLNSQGYMSLHMGMLFEHHTDYLRPVWDRMISYMTKKGIHPKVRKDHIFPMSKVNEAHLMVENRKNFGKIILDPSK